jgi:YbgC/YbaW family acyl-CoA thioester hydrolase
MPYEHRVRRRVEFSDTDMAGIMHYSNFFRFMETAEHQFFRALGFSIVTDTTHPPVGWPRVHAACEYRHPLRFEDEVEIQLLVCEKRTRALRYAFRFFRVSPPPHLEVAQARLVVVCVSREDGRSMSAVPIPKEIVGAIEVAPADLLAGLWTKTPP